MKLRHDNARIGTRDSAEADCIEFTFISFVRFKDIMVASHAIA